LFKNRHNLSLGVADLIVEVSHLTGEAFKLEILDLEESVEGRHGIGHYGYDRESLVFW
jgi:hypothetical protein